MPHRSPSQLACLVAAALHRRSAAIERTASASTSWFDGAERNMRSHRAMAAVTGVGP